MGSMVDLVNSITFDAGLLPLAVDATVTPPGEAAVEDVPVLWLVPTLPDTPANPAFKRGEVRRVMAIQLSDVPNAGKRGTTVAAPEKPGDSSADWKVDRVELKEADHVRVILIPD